jgi:hypothetical protein
VTSTNDTTEPKRAQLEQLEIEISTLAGFLSFANEGRADSFPIIMKENRRKLRLACERYLEHARLLDAETQPELEPVRLGDKGEG